MVLCAIPFIEKIHSQIGILIISISHIDSHRFIAIGRSTPIFYSVFIIIVKKQCFGCYHFAPNHSSQYLYSTNQIIDVATAAATVAAATAVAALAYHNNFTNNLVIVSEFAKKLNVLLFGAKPIPCAYYSQREFLSLKRNLWQTKSFSFIKSSTKKYVSVFLLRFRAHHEHHTFA